MTPSERINLARAAYDAAENSEDGKGKGSFAMLRNLSSTAGYEALSAADELAEATKAFMASATPIRRRRVRKALNAYYGDNVKEQA